MIENNVEKKQRAVLVAVDTGEYDARVSLDELEELAVTAGAETAAKVLQKRSGFDPATVIGSGRLSEIAEFCRGDGADLVVFDCELSPAQMRNIEDACGVPVIDRTTLILDIFAQRAVTAEGKLQVELAQLRYRLPRLTGLGGALSRLGGGIGTRGPGESQLETDRRHIRRRIAALQDQLAELEKRRGLLRARRKKEGITTVAIVGYTNVGKSTLLNALTNAGVLVEDKLFATLDPTSRALSLPDGREVLLIDTVGLVRRLPHQLVEAFKSTLEEAANADLLWCVCDASSDETDEQVAVTRRLMEEPAWATSRCSCCSTNATSSPRRRSSLGSAPSCSRRKPALASTTCSRRPPPPLRPPIGGCACSSPTTARDWSMRSWRAARSFRRSTRPKEPVSTRSST